jgi:aminopeptidase N
MTDTLASLTALANSHYSKREQILEEYYQKWQKQPDLVDKWLTLQAMIKLPGTLERIQSLIQQPRFNIKNPNKVYALIRAFCENNHINFHAQNGAGYKFLADHVLAIDTFNPHLAAAITAPLTRGYKLDKTRKLLLQQQLMRINKEPTLSKNVYEIISKAISIQHDFE